MFSFFLNNMKINLKNSCLIVIDMQRFFVESSDSFNFNDFYSSNIHNIIKKCEEVINYFEQKKLPVFYTKQIMDTQSLLYKKNKGRLSKLKKTEWNKLIFDCNKNDIIEKTTHDAFFKTSLENKLNELNITKIFFCGVYTNICVESTLRSAFFRNFYPILIYDATLSYNSNVMNTTFDIIRTFYGKIISIESLIKELNCEK